MRVVESRPSFAAMETNTVLRIGAVAAFAGAAAWLLSEVLEPSRTEEAAHDVRVIADSNTFIPGRVVDLVGTLLTVAALAVVTRTLSERAGGEWARFAFPFLVLLGALASSAILADGSLREVANSWSDAAPEAKQSYVAAFAVGSSLTGALLWGAFMALGLYAAAMAPAILAAGLYRRWIGWALAASAVLVIAGNMSELVWDPAFVALLAGWAVFVACVVALGASMWAASEPVAAPAATEGR